MNEKLIAAEYFGGELYIKVSDYHRVVQAQVAAEREACAQIAEEWLGPTKDRELHIAVAIRARGQDPMPLFDDWEGGFPYKDQK
jgi:hypothetical protein